VSARVPAGKAPSSGDGAADPSVVLSYLLSGVLFWGGVGWLVDEWLDTRGFVALGILAGAVAGVALIYLKYGRPPGEERQER